MADAEKGVTADQGGRINLGKSRAGRSFRLLEQGNHLILEPEETVHVPASEAWSRWQPAILSRAPISTPPMPSPTPFQRMTPLRTDRLAGVFMSSGPPALQRVLA